MSLGAAHFEGIYSRDPDPWDFETSAYEQGKYERTLAALPAGRIASALDVGCSTGVLSSRLAEHCDELLAVDFSERALVQARARLASLPGARVERLDLPSEMPPGPFDLVVCSEVLWYWSERDVLDGLRRIETSLVPGGSLLVVGWSGRDPEAPMNGPEVSALIDGSTSLRRELHEAANGAGYVIDRWAARA